MKQADLRTLLETVEALCAFAQSCHERLIHFGEHDPDKPVAPPVALVRAEVEKLRPEKMKAGAPPPAF